MRRVMAGDKRTARGQTKTESQRRRADRSREERLTCHLQSQLKGFLKNKRSLDTRFTQERCTQWEEVCLTRCKETRGFPEVSQSNQHAACNLEVYPRGGASDR